MLIFIGICVVSLVIYCIYDFVLTEEICEEERFNGYTGIPKIPYGCKDFVLIDNTKKGTVYQGWKRYDGILLFRHTKTRVFKPFYRW
jgi:hypothetical protein